MNLYFLHPVASTGHAASVGANSFARNALGVRMNSHLPTHQSGKLGVRMNSHPQTHQSGKLR